MFVGAYKLPFITQMRIAVGANEILDLLLYHTLVTAASEVVMEFAFLKYQMFPKCLENASRHVNFYKNATYISFPTKKLPLGKL